MTEAESCVHTHRVYVCINPPHPPTQTNHNHKPCVITLRIAAIHDVSAGSTLSTLRRGCPSRGGRGAARNLRALRQAIRRHQLMSTDTFDFESQGKHDAPHRRPGLPSDLACLACGGAIEHGDPCIDADGTRGINEYGEFSADGDERTLRCLDCADG